MYELTITGHFSSAHFLRGHEGACKDLHGHTWKVEVSIRSEKLNEIGLVVDFHDLKKRLKEFLKALDHVCLNDVAGFQEVNPSTENLAKYIFQEFSRKCLPLKIIKVRVWESETSSVIYYED